MVVEQKVWGPKFWELLHYITTLYPVNPTETDKQMMTKFIHSYEHAVPCNTCKHHLQINLTKIPLSKNDLLTQKNIIMWGIKLHNLVNETLRKMQKFDPEKRVPTELQKYTGIDLKKLLITVLTYVNIKTPNIEPELNGALKDLIYGVAYFGKNKKLRIDEILTKKKADTLLDTKKNFELLIMYLRSNN